MRQTKIQNRKGVRTFTNNGPPGSTYTLFKKVSKYRAFQHKTIQRLSKSVRFFRVYQIVKNKNKEPNTIFYLYTT